MTRLNWDLTWHEAKWFRKTKILKFGWLLKLPKILEIAQKVNECPLGPVTEPNGFKLDMLGPEGSLPFCWTWSPKGGLRVKKVASEAKNCPKSQRYWPNSQWSLSGLKLTWKLTWNFWLEIDQKVNGIDQIVNDWHKKWIRIGPSGLNRIGSNRLKSDWIEWIRFRTIALKLTRKNGFESDRMDWNWIESDRMDWNWIESDRLDWIGIF